jgi:hypothetical protein
MRKRVYCCRVVLARMRGISARIFGLIINLAHKEVGDEVPIVFMRYFIE